MTDGLRTNSRSLFRKRHKLNDNTNTTTTKTAIAAALVAEAGLTADDAARTVAFMTTEGIIDFPVAAELYEGVRD
jgi:hypothetical protein